MSAPETNLPSKRDVLESQKEREKPVQKRVSGTVKAIGVSVLCGGILYGGFRAGWKPLAKLGLNRSAKVAISRPPIPKGPGPGNAISSMFTTDSKSPEALDLQDNPDFGFNRPDQGNPFGLDFIPPANSDPGPSSDIADLNNPNQPGNPPAPLPPREKWSLNSGNGNLNQMFRKGTARDLVNRLGKPTLWYPEGEWILHYEYHNMDIRDDFGNQFSKAKFKIYRFQTGRTYVDSITVSF